MSDSYKPIDLTRSRYDLTTFTGRLRHFAEVTSPLTLLKSNSQLIDAQKLLEDYAQGKRKDLYNSKGEDTVYKAKQRTASDLLVAKRCKATVLIFAVCIVVDSSLHPDTKKPVPLPFRLAAFTPTNLSESSSCWYCTVLMTGEVIVGGMLAPNPSVSCLLSPCWYKADDLVDTANYLLGQFRLAEFATRSDARVASS